MKAQIIVSRDRSYRRPVDTPATMRIGCMPIDVVVDDISVSGFHMATGERLAVNTPITIGIPGIRFNAARVVRSTPTGFGCRFFVPISEADVERTGIETVVDADFQGAWNGSPPEPERTRWLRWLEVAIILAMAITCSAIIVGVFLTL